MSDLKFKPEWRERSKRFRRMAWISLQRAFVMCRQDDLFARRHAGMPLRRPLVVPLSMRVADGRPGIEISPEEYEAVDGPCVHGRPYGGEDCGECDRGY